MSDEEVLRSALGEDFPRWPDAVAPLRAYGDLVRKWNSTVNVVARSTVDDLWMRHIVDSAQIFRRAPVSARFWLDIGSGGGFPGIVVATLAKCFRPDLRVRMVEIDKRKSVFLRECIRLLDLPADVVALRVEALAPQAADVVSARALAPLTTLCAYAARHLTPGGIAIFLKGQHYEEELVEAKASWKFDLECVESLTNKGSAVLVMKGLKHV